MHRAKYLMFSALAVACAGFLTFGQAADVSQADRTAHYASALGVIR